jgi:hypothetical protein
MLMRGQGYAAWTLSREARSLLDRLARLQPFALQETMVPAAAFTTAAQTAVERFLSRGRRALRCEVLGYLDWLHSDAGRWASPEEAQRRLVFLRLRFNSVLSQFDIFSEAQSQRSGHDVGIWLAGLDELARDALELPGLFEAPPVICYLARGPGAAIRRAHTRLPGGDDNPVAIIRVPRERMIGSALASSLVHEVGHQGAALLGLVHSLRPRLREAERRSAHPDAWLLWERWLSEIVADLWSVARVGVCATNGMMGVLSLPAAFIFRDNAEDPHPTPWIRVLLSAALGEALYPHPQWRRLVRLWQSYYPAARIRAAQRAMFDSLLRTIPELVRLLLEHRPAQTGHRSLADVMATAERQPARLATELARWRARPSRMRSAPASLVFAVIGQARSDGAVTPEAEGRILAAMLRHWALRSTLTSAATTRSAARSQNIPIVAVG